MTAFSPLAPAAQLLSGPPPSADPSDAAVRKRWAYASQNFGRSIFARLSAIDSIDDRGWILNVYLAPSGFETYVRVAGAWVKASDIQVRVAGSWVSASNVYVRVGGAWVSI